MNIEDLEFIRDFDDDLSNLADCLQQLYVYFSNSDCERDMEINLTIAALRSMYYQSDLLKRRLEIFKNKIDEKYLRVWQEKYPQMQLV